MRPRSETSPARHPAKLALTLVLLLLLVPLAAGCGGGGDEGGGGQGGGDNGKTATTKTTAGGKPAPEPGSMIKNFAVRVSSANQATITANLAKPSALTLRVHRIAGTERTPVGKVALGSKPAGQVSIPWDLRVEGKQLPPGRYRVTLRTRDAGRSTPATITVPGG